MGKKIMSEVKKYELPLLVGYMAIVGLAIIGLNIYHYIVDPEDAIEMLKVLAVAAGSAIFIVFPAYRLVKNLEKQEKRREK